MSKRARGPSIRAAMAEPATSALTRWAKWGPVLLIALAVLLTFWRVVTSEFTTWDDDIAIWNNPTFNPPTLHSLFIWWSTANHGMWNPVVETVRGLLALAPTASRDPVTGTHLNPYLFHFTNLVIHVCTTLMVYQVLRLLRFARWPACAGALVFGIHPLQVEPVAWITAMKDVLCGFFAIGAIWLYLRSRGFDLADDHPWPGKDTLTNGPRWCFWLATVLFLLATLSKPTAVVMPLAVLALACLRWNVLPRRIWLDMLFWFALAIPSIVVMHMVQPGAQDTFVPLWQRPLVAMDAIAFYLLKLVWPASLTIDYGRRPVVIFERGWAYWTWVFPVGLAIVVGFLTKRARTLAVGAVVFLIPLLPVLGLLSFDYQRVSTVADRYVYLSFLGAALCAAWSVGRLPGKAALVPCLILAAMGLRSSFQTRHWQDSMALFTHALERNPQSAAALVNLGVAFDRTGQIPTEINYLNRAIALRPEQPQAYLGLGTALVKSGRWDLAADAYRRGFAVQPQIVGNEVIRLAGDYGKTSQPTEAMEYGRLAVELRPDSAMAHLDLGSALAEAGDRVGAIEELRKAVELDSSSVIAQCNLATTLVATGQYDEAAEHYEAALRTHPGFAAAEKGLAALRRIRLRAPAVRPE